MLATCPHCHKDIDLMEPKDLDELGLTPNVRGPLIKSDALPVWATLRGGKFFLFLREEVGRVQNQRVLTAMQKTARAASRTDEEYERLMKAMEKALQEGDGVEPAPRSTPQRRRR